jgi:hypothetical protein
MFCFRFFKKFFQRRYYAASAMILTMFIMSGMILVAMSGAYVVLLGIRAGGIQAQSGKAYFAAESGAEHILWELRKNSLTYTNYGVSDEESLLTGAVTFSYSADYQVYYTGFNPLIFRSVGDFQTTSRSVEVAIGQ